MSSQVFPSLTGQEWNIERLPIWDTIVQEARSGKETRIANYTYPRWQWTVSFSALRQGLVHGTSYTELAQLAGFYNARQGRFDSFLYTDSDDNSVTGQSIGTGNGVATTFQLVRSFGSFIEPVLAPNIVVVKVAGVTKTAGVHYNLNSWGSLNAGTIVFTAGNIPTVGQAITADFSYYFPCRFLEDNIAFNKFTSNMYEGQKVSFISLKN